MNTPRRNLAITLTIICSAVTLFGMSGNLHAQVTDLGSAVGASVASGNTCSETDDFPISCAAGGGVDAAFMWTAPTSGTFTFDTGGSNYDTALALYSSDGLTELACNDDFIGLQSSIDFSLTAGQMIIIVVDGFSNSCGDYVLNISGGGGGGGGLGDLGSAVGASVASGNTCSETDDFPISCAAGGGVDAAFMWTAPTSGTFTFDTGGSTYDTALALYSSDGLTELACNDDFIGLQSSIDFSLTAGQMIIIVVDGFENSCGDYVLNISGGGLANSPPTAICQNVLVSADPGQCSSSAVTPADVDNGSNDPEDGTSLTLSLSPAGPYNVGVTNVVLTVTDSGGLMDTCAATITVTDDELPVLTLSGSDPITIECGVDTYNELGATASDNCPGVGAVVVGGETVDESTPGTYTVTYNVSDAAGNPATEVTREVTVEDTLDPVIEGAKDIVVTAPTGGPSDAVFYTLTATDACDPSVTVVCVPPSGSTFALGSHTVNCTATDDEGNVGMASFEVIVLEVQPTPGPRMLTGLALRGDAASGAGIPAGATIFNINKAFLNNSGRVIYDAQLLNAGTMNYAVFVGPAFGPHTGIATRNTAAPGGGTYGFFSSLSLNDAGAASFETTGPGQYVDTGGGAAVGAVKGGVATAVGGSPTYNTLQKPALASNGELLTSANLQIGSGAPAVEISDDTVITSSAGTLIAREGGTTSIASTDYDHLNPRVATSERNERFIFSSSLREASFDASDNTGLFVGTLGGPLPPLVLREGDTAAGTGGGIFSQFLGESVNSSGQWVVRANTRGTGISASNNEGLWTDGGNTLIAREGDVAPCLPTTLVAFDRFQSFSIAEDGSVCFHAFLKNATTTLAVNSANDGSIWRWSGGQLHLIAREGDVSNSTNAAIINSIDEYACNNIGGVVYQVRYLTNLGDTTTTNNIGIYLDDGTGLAPELVLRRSDTFELMGMPRTVVGLKINTEVNRGGATGGYGRAINDMGSVILNLTLSGNTSGLFILDSPPPL